MKNPLDILFFVERHPTIKMLALSFLLLIGMALISDGLERHIPKVGPANKGGSFPGICIVPGRMPPEVMFLSTPARRDRGLPSRRMPVRLMNPHVL